MGWFIFYLVGCVVSFLLGRKFCKQMDEWDNKMMLGAFLMSLLSWVSIPVALFIGKKMEE